MNLSNIRVVLALFLVFWLGVLARTAVDRFWYRDLAGGNLSVLGMAALVILTATALVAED